MVSGAAGSGDLGPAAAAGAIPAITLACSSGTATTDLRVASLGAHRAAAVAPGWLAGVIDGSGQQVYGQRIDNLRLPASETTRKKLAEQYGRDGYLLLEAVHAPGAPGWLRELPAVECGRSGCSSTTG